MTIINTKKNKGQNLIEYTLILGIVVAAIVAMQAYFKRGIQSLIRVAADDYGTQGDVVRDVERAVKERVYAERGGISTNSTSDGRWTQNINNLGDSNIQTEIEGAQTLTGTSVWVGGDYRNRTPLSPGSQ